MISIDCLKEYIEQLKNVIEIKQEFSGHSSAYRYILKYNNNNRFFKLYNGNRVENIKYIDKIYCDLKIDTAKVIKTQYITQLDKTYVIYEYIEGETLKELTKKLSEKELEDIGKEVGKQLQKFNKIIGDTITVQKNLEEELNSLMDKSRNLKIYYEQSTKKELPYIDLDKLFVNINDLKKYVYMQNPIFIHNDINLGNVIVKNSKPYFIDTDGGKIKYRALNFRGNCWYGYKGDNILRERAIYRGIYKGLFNDDIPLGFHKELAFTMIYEFMLRLTRYPEDIKQIEYSFYTFKHIFDLTNYFVDYTFDWFYM